MNSDGEICEITSLSREVFQKTWRQQLLNMPKSKVSEETKEKLIELVRQHPPLFDAKCPEHKDAQWTENIWRSIATIQDGWYW